MSTSTLVFLFIWLALGYGANNFVTEVYYASINVDRRKCRKLFRQNGLLDFSLSGFLAEVFLAFFWPVWIVIVFATTGFLGNNPKERHKIRSKLVHQLNGDRSPLLPDEGADAFDN